MCVTSKILARRTALLPPTEPDEPGRVFVYLGRIFCTLDFVMCTLQCL
jgi:hypothetical protein